MEDILHLAVGKQIAAYSTVSEYTGPQTLHTSHYTLHTQTLHTSHHTLLACSVQGSGCRVHTLHTSYCTLQTSSSS